MRFLILVGITLVFSGCFTPKQEVLYIPQRCDVVFPAYPLPRNNAVENLKDLAIYTEKLECALDFCINGKNLIPHCAKR